MELSLEERKAMLENELANIQEQIKEQEEKERLQKEQKETPFSVQLVDEEEGIFEFSYISDDTGEKECIEYTNDDFLKFVLAHLAIANGEENPAQFVNDSISIFRFLFNS